MTFQTLLRDVRKRRGTIWNVQDVLRRFPLGAPHAPWNRSGQTNEQEWIDKFVYQGFRQHGEEFLRALRGKFAVAFVDEERGELFLARDWIGEEPFHYVATLKSFIVGNTIADLKSAAAADYSYAYVRAFPQSHYQLIDLKDVRMGAVSATLHLATPVLYYDFSRAVEEARNQNVNTSLATTCGILRDRLQASVTERLSVHRNRRVYLLLSGGLDSFSVALALKKSGIPFEAVTMSVKGGGGDVAVAKEFAKRLGLQHHVFNVEPEQVLNAFEESILLSECYHLYNIYCAVGMHLLGKMMKEQGLEIAFCGEAVNEALGDYHDWIIKDPRTQQEVVLQKINSERLEKVDERLAYSWGRSADAGIYNKQLGTGLAKHAGSRMYKPFQHHGLYLEAPYYDRTLLQEMISISPEVLKKIGGKPGLFLKVFQRDLERLGIPKDLVMNCKKVRFQDASEGGEGGITDVLFRQGMDQKRAIELFNRIFESHLDPVLETRRLVCTASA